MRSTLVSKKSNRKKVASWLISAILAWMLAELINTLLHSFTTFDHIPALFLGIFKNYNNFWDKIFYFLIFIGLMCIFLITIQSIEHRVRLLIFRKQLPNVISEFGKLKRKINQTIVSLIDAGDDTHIKRQDEVYADLLRQMRSEFDIEGVSIDSISRCTTQLANILHNQNVDELYALTNLYGDSWLTRNMLLYLIRTIQIADKINNENNKLRVFLRNSEGNNSDTEAYNSVKSLHEGFLPIKELKLNEFRNKFPSSMDAFLYLKLSNSELFWYIERFETKLVWNGANSSTNNDTATEIKSIVNHLKSI